MRTELSLSDEWETPDELYQYLVDKYDISPSLDVASNEYNTKCLFRLKNGLTDEWVYTSWCNPPHSLNEEFVKRAYDQWVKHNITIMMILPANSLCTNYAENWIEPFAEDHPINRKFCKFLYKGQKKDSSRNGYRVVIWREIAR